jgi:hypothetical protein
LFGIFQILSDCQRAPFPVPSMKHWFLFLYHYNYFGEDHSQCSYRSKIISTGCRRQIIPVPPVPSLYYLSGDGRVITFRGVITIEHRNGVLFKYSSHVLKNLKLVIIVIYLITLRSSNLVLPRQYCFLGYFCPFHKIQS